MLHIATAFLCVNAGLALATISGVYWAIGALAQRGSLTTSLGLFIGLLGVVFYCLSILLVLVTMVDPALLLLIGPPLGSTPPVTWCECAGI